LLDFETIHVQEFQGETKKLRRLQTINKRRENALLMMARQVKDKMFKKIELVVRKKYP
jgi:hypothetical protein